MDRPTCKTCPYWDETRTLDAGLGSGIRGECRVRAPERPPSRAGVATGDIGVWPETFGDDWCGSHPDMADYIRSLKGEKTAFPRAAIAIKKGEFLKFCDDGMVRPLSAGATSLFFAGRDFAEGEAVPLDLDTDRLC